MEEKEKGLERKVNKCRWRKGERNMEERRKGGRKLNWKSTKWRENKKNREKKNGGRMERRFREGE